MDVVVTAAVQRVIGNNFKGDATEPKWLPSRGWSGDVRRGRAKGVRTRTH
jgi:hypothetical protein